MFSKIFPYKAEMNAFKAQLLKSYSIYLEPTK